MVSYVVYDSSLMPSLLSHLQLPTDIAVHSHLVQVLGRVATDAEGGWGSVFRGLSPPLAALNFHGRTIAAEPFERVVAVIGVLGRLRDTALAPHWPGIVAKLHALPPLLRLRAYAMCRLGAKPGSAVAWAEVWPLFAEWLEHSAMASRETHGYYLYPQTDT
jgi:hypothetical protein